MGRSFEVNDIGTLNRMIEAGKGQELIRLAEALQEKKIAQIADEITRDRERVRLVMIAGPSSSGENHLYPALGDPTSGQRGPAGLDFAG